MYFIPFRALSRAFTLIETIMSIMALSMVTAGIMLSSLVIIEVRNYAEDVGTAQDRADQVFSILKLPLDHCGYGLPHSSSGYDAVFKALSNHPFDWDGVISVADAMVASASRKNGTCRIVYGIPSGVRTRAEAATSEDIFVLEMTGVPKLLELVHSGESPNSVKDWALFGSMLPECRPIWLAGVIADSGASKKMRFRWYKPLSPDCEIYIPENDELFYLGAIECKVGIRNGEFLFYVNDFKGDGEQPRESGVVDIRFELDDSKRLLKVMLLVAGNIRYDEIKTKRTPTGWTEEYASDIPESARHYRLFAYTELFGLKNF